MKGFRNFNLDSDFYCCKCGKKGINIIRKNGQGREQGHLKKLYCLNCKEEWNHAECKEGSRYSHEDFLVEFNNNNFDENGERILTYKKLIQKLTKEGENENE